MIIFYEPDATKYPQSFLDIAKHCNGLEQLTGADFVIAKLPIPPTNNLKIHIDSKALFVQLKIDYDICSFDQLHSSIARMQQCKIPKGQAVLLPIGEYWQDENGLLRVKGQKAFGDTRYTALGTIYDMWSMRGGIVEPLPPKDTDGLMGWIERKWSSIEKIEKEGTRDIYSPSPVFQPDDIWQEVKEIKDWRKTLVSGLDNFGSKKANAIFNYIRDETPESEYNFYFVLSILTDEDTNGKAIHSKVPLWGDASRKDLREKLGLIDGWNLGELSYRIAFYHGWKAFGQEFVRLIAKKKKLSTQVLNETIGKMLNESSLKEIEDQIPF